MSAFAGEGYWHTDPSSGRDLPCFHLHSNCPFLFWLSRCSSAVFVHLCSRSSGLTPCRKWFPVKCLGVYIPSTLWGHSFCCRSVLLWQAGRRNCSARQRCS